MKKILFSLMAIALVVGLVGAGALAYMDDTETSDDNTFTAGTLDLKVDDDDDPNVGTKVSVGPGIPADPAEVVADPEAAIADGRLIIVGPIELCNAGDIDGIIDLHFLNVVDSGGENMDPYDNASSEPEYVAEGGTYDEDVPDQNNDPVNELSKHILVDCAIFDADTGDMLWCDILGKLYDIRCNTFYLCGLAPAGEDGDCVNLYLSFIVQESADNNDQGDVSTFDIKFTLTQPEAVPAV